MYDITTIYVLVKFVTRPYDGKKLFLDLCLSCLSVGESSRGIADRLAILHEDSSKSSFRGVTLDCYFFINNIVLENWGFSQVLLNCVEGNTVLLYSHCHSASLSSSLRSGSVISPRCGIKFDQ